MATDPDPDDHVRRRSSSTQSWVMCLVVVLCCYLVPFGLVWLDEFVLKSFLFDRSMRAVSPAFGDRVSELMRLIYWPVLEGLRQLKILPS